jgi:ribosomal protein L11 methyltransferase
VTERSLQRCTLDMPAERYDLAVAALLDLGPGGWQEEAVESGRMQRLTFWLPADPPGPDSAAALKRLRELGEMRCEAEVGDWAEAWKRFHTPVAIAGLTVRAPWHEATAGSLDVVIDVGMAFGTGSHATTRGCLAALAGLERGSLLDLGTGSGVLALAALRLGFAPVWACDNDPEAVGAARANARRNDLRPRLFLADCTDPAVELPDTDVVVANLLLEPILVLGERYSALVAGGGARPSTIVLSGLLADQAAAAQAAFRGFECRRLDCDGEWVTLTFEAV